MFKRVEELEKLKKNHVQTMKLIAYLARDPVYWDFIDKGMSKEKRTKSGFILEDDDDVEIDSRILASIIGSDYRSAPFYPPFERSTNSLQKLQHLISSGADLDQRELIWIQTNLIIEQNNLIKELKKEIKGTMPAELPRWCESPLIVGAKMGLHDFVGQILKVCVYISFQVILLVFIAFMRVFQYFSSHF